MRASCGTVTCWKGSVAPLSSAKGLTLRRACQPSLKELRIMRFPSAEIPCGGLRATGAGRVGHGRPGQARSGGRRLAYAGFVEPLDLRYQQDEETAQGDVAGLQPEPVGEAGVAVELGAAEH